MSRRDHGLEEGGGPGVTGGSGSRSPPPRGAKRRWMASARFDLDRDAPVRYDRLSPEAKQCVVQLSLLGFEPAADFEISLMGWLGAPPTKNALPTEPALAPINPSMIQCFYGKDESDSLCPSLASKHEVTVIETEGGPFQRRLRPARPANFLAMQQFGQDPAVGDIGWCRHHPHGSAWFGYRRPDAPSCRNTTGCSSWSDASPDRAPRPNSWSRTVH